MKSFDPCHLSKVFQQDLATIGQEGISRGALLEDLKFQYFKIKSFDPCHLPKVFQQDLGTIGQEGFSRGAILKDLRFQ
jgi:hypothetical protein